MPATGLGLADADGLDRHHVEAGGLTQQHRLARAPGAAAERAGRRRRADESRVGTRELAHARLVTEDRAARPGARRVDGEHSDAMAVLDEVQAEGLDERRLARARRAGDADPDGVARVR
jgi:hypothetical protein